jgi:arylsulfatase A-like enzyme
MPRIIAIVLTFLCFGAAPAKPVNILWLSTEDMSPWLGCYGDETVPTPNIDRLAREGIRYTNAFATTPVCAPARHTIITGMYASSTGALHMRNHTRSEQAFKKNPRAYDDIPLYEAVPPPQVRCFSEYLREAGYYCTNNVKTDYQFIPPPTAWDENSRTAHWRNRREGQPFFAVFNCTFTHESQAFPKADKRADVVKPADVKIPPYYPDTPAVRETLAQTCNNIHAMDRWVGEHLAALEADGLLDSTVIMFFSDHGMGLPRGKRAAYDSGIQVPLIVRFPDQRRAGSTEDRLVSFIDWAPTAMSLAGLRQPQYMRGVPFLGEFIGEPPRYAFVTSDRVDVTRDMIRAVTDGRFKYIRNFTTEVPHLPPVAYRDTLVMMNDLRELKSSGEATPAQWQTVSDSKPPEEFYDTEQDPHEVKNLIDDPQHADRIKAMREALQRWMDETGDMGQIQPESKLVKEKIYPPDGVQPTTAKPEASFSAADGGNLLMTLQCATEGASIGYRKKGEKVWSLYVKPVAVEAGEPQQLIAHRIGFKPSEIVRMQPSVSRP